MAKGAKGCGCHAGAPRAPVPLPHPGRHAEGKMKCGALQTGSPELMTERMDCFTTHGLQRKRRAQDDRPHINTFDQSGLNLEDSSLWWIQMTCVKREASPTIHGTVASMCYATEAPTNAQPN